MTGERRDDTLTHSVVRVDTTAPHVVLTYDDGPQPGGTDRILVALAEAGATATFFVLLSKVRRDPTLLVEVMSAGHEIGLHGSDHRNLTALPLAEVRRRTREAKTELEDVTGRAIRWFRAPYGAQSLGVVEAVRGAGLVPVCWSASWQDWADMALDARMALALAGIGPGAIVLAHDGFAGSADGVDDGRAPSFDRGELSRHILAAYRDLGLSARSLSDALVTGTPVMERWITD